MPQQIIKTYGSKFLYDRGKFVMWRDGYIQQGYETLVDGGIRVTWEKKPPNITLNPPTQKELMMSSVPHIRGAVASILKFEGSKYLKQ